MTSDIAGRLLEALRPTRHLLTRTLAGIPIGSAECRQVDRVVQEIDVLAEIRTGDRTRFSRNDRPAKAPGGWIAPLKRESDFTNSHKERRISRWRR